MQSAPHSICLVRLSALGDVVLATALLRTLQAGLPGSTITWITCAVTRELLGDLPGVEWLVVPRPMRWRDYLELRHKLRGRRFDVLLAAQASFRANLVHACVPARRKIGFDARRGRDLHGWFVDERIADRDEHLADGFLAFAEAVGVPRSKHVRQLSLSVRPDEAAAARARVGADRYFVINPAASKPERNWPAERYAEAANHVVRRTGWRLVLTGGGGRAESALAAAVRRRLEGSVVDLVGRTGVRELAAILAGAEGVLAPDTGPVHLATACGVPVVGLYAVARSSLTGPWPDRSYCVDRHGEAVERLMGRKPSEVGWHARVHDGRAMEEISVADVCAQLDRLIAARGVGK